MKFGRHSIHYIYEITQNSINLSSFKNKGPSDKVIGNINDIIQELRKNIEIFIEEQNNLFLDDEISRKMFVKWISIKYRVWQIN